MLMTEEMVTLLRANRMNMTTRRIIASRTLMRERDQDVNSSDRWTQKFDQSFV